MMAMILAIESNSLFGAQISILEQSNAQQNTDVLTFALTAS